MGSWTETCAITNQPLIGPAYCVTLPFSTDMQLRIMNLFKVDIAIGELNCYGELEDVSQKTKDKKYSVEEYHDPRGKICVIFASKNAWEKVILKIKKDGLDYSSFDEIKKDYLEHFNGYTKFSELTELHFEWYLIEKFLYNIRRTFILNNDFSGSQDEDYDNLNFANSLIENKNYDG
jgi:hypothetical protein